MAYRYIHTHIYIYICVCYMCIYRERERERETYLCVYIYTGAGLACQTVSPHKQAIPCQVGKHVDPGARSAYIITRRDACDRPIMEQ